MMTSSAAAAAAAATMGWISGELGAANAIIDALCEHLTEMGGGEEAAYERVFEAIRRRRVNWFPFLVTTTLNSHPINDVTAQLHHLRKTNAEEDEKVMVQGSDSDPHHHNKQQVLHDETGEGHPSSPPSTSSSSSSDSSPKVTKALIFSDHDTELAATFSQRTLDCKRFVAKENVKGRMVNVVKGLKLYEDILTELELSRLHGFINDLRVAGRNGELSDDTYFFFNKQLKGNRREVIQFGVPIFQTTVTEEESTRNIEAIPSILEDLINHLIQWRLIPENKRPNSCIINFFDKDDHSQPYSKPPHLENPITNLVLHDTMITFGKALVSDQQGDFNGSLRLSLKKGSLIVMHGHSADMAKHVVCPSQNTRVSITFARVRQNQSPTSSSNAAVMASSSHGRGLIPVPTTPPLWLATSQLQLQPVTPIIMVPTAAVPHPVVPLPIGPVVSRAGKSGTGVFLPWTMGPKRHVKQLPPRIQKKRLPSLQPLMQMQVQSSQEILSLDFDHNSSYRQLIPHI